MSRGPRSDKALAAAVPVARMRGEVMFFEQRPGTCFDFMTGGPAGPGAVRVERALRIHGSHAQIAADHAGTIDRITAAALAPGIARELWLWSPWGTMRYFRIEGMSITELDLLGNVRAPLVKGARANAMRPRWRKSRKKSGSATPAPAPGPGHPPAAGNHVETAGTAVPGTEGALQPPGTSPQAPAPAGTSGREPAPVRFLRKRNAELQRKKDDPRAVPGGVPGPATHGGRNPPT